MNASGSDICEVVRRVSGKTAFDIELPRTVFECGLFCTRNGLWLILGMDYHIADSPPVVKHYLVAQSIQCVTQKNDCLVFGVCAHGGKPVEVLLSRPAVGCKNGIRVTPYCQRA